MKRLSAILLAFCLLFGTVPAAAKKQNSDLNVTVLDVGQGLSIFAECDGHTLLYDGGDRSTSSYVVSFLKKQGVKKLDYVIASHYDADHINGLVGALSAIGASHFFGPDYTCDTNIYDSLMNAARKNGLKNVHPKVGSTWNLGSAKMEVLGPIDSHYSNANDRSIVIKLSNGKTSMLTTGDATSTAEHDLVLRDDLALESDVLVAGHHGSKSSNSQEFLDTVHPEDIIISCGRDNKYGHPDKVVMERIKKSGANLYRTDTQGAVGFTLGENTVTFSLKPSKDYKAGQKPEEKKTEKKAAPKPAEPQAPAAPEAPAAPAAPAEPEPVSQTWILNTHTRKIHYPDCRAVARMAAKNKAESSESVAALEAQGYEPCKICHPQ